jgi:hypothetical protein
MATAAVVGQVVVVELWAPHTLTFASFVGGAGTPGQGYNGGAPYGGGYPPFGPGGGGGAGGQGGKGSSDGVGGVGGAGIASNITGTLLSIMLLAAVG